MKASVIFLSYNHASFVGDALRSALNQDYPEYELIVHDDGSVDGTRQIIETILASEVPPHVRVVLAGDGKNHGLVEAFNRATRVSTGEILLHISGDDISYPCRLKRTAEVFKKHPDVMLVVSETQRIDENGNNLKHPRCIKADKIFSYDKKPSYIYAKSPILGAAAAYRARIAKDFDPIKPDFCHAEDNVYWVRALILGQIYYIAEPLLFYRLHTNNFTENQWKWRNGITDSLKDAHLQFAKKHAKNFLQWELDIRHALRNDFINKSKAAQILKTAKLDAMRWALLVSSLKVEPWGEWFRLALESLKLGGVKVIISKLKLRLSNRRRLRYWNKHEKSMIGQ